MFEAELKATWLSVSDVALPIAKVRDDFLSIKGGEARFVQLADVYGNMNNIEQALFEYIELKAPMLGKKPDREMLIIADAAIENAKIFLEVARNELALLRKVAE